MENPVVTRFLVQPGGLAEQLASARTSAGLGARELADRLGWPASKVSRIQNGKVIPTAEDVEAWAKECGVKPAGRRTLIEAVEGARIFHLERRTMGRPPADRQADYNITHAGATSITMVEPLAIPGPLQTLDYARAVLTMGYQQLDQPLVGIEAAARARLERAQYLADETKKYRFIIGARTLSPKIAGPGVTAAQLTRLLDLTKPDHVGLTIVPDAAPVLVLHSFALYDSTVIIELLAGEMVASDRASVDQYRRLADRFADVGLSEPDSRALIAETIETLVAVGE